MSCLLRFAEQAASFVRLENKLVQSCKNTVFPKISSLQSMFIKQNDGKFVKGSFFKFFVEDDDNIGCFK